MEYLKIEGEFPKLANCAVTMENLTGSTVATGNWLRRSGSGRHLENRLSFLPLMLPAI